MASPDSGSILDVIIPVVSTVGPLLLATMPKVVRALMAAQKKPEANGHITETAQNIALGSLSDMVKIIQGEFQTFGLQQRGEFDKILQRINDEARERRAQDDTLKVAINALGVRVTALEKPEEKVQ